MDFLSLVAKLSLDSSAYESGLTKAKGLASGIGSTIGGGLKTLAHVGATALAGATTAVTGFAAASVKTGMDFDKAMSQVQATMLKTDAEMENEMGTAILHTSEGVKEFTGNLREFAMFLGGNTVFSATEAAEALNYMALAGYDTQQSMDMLPSVLSLAAAGGFDLARASDMVTDAQTAFGLSAERTALMVDEMAKAAATGNTSVEQLGDAFLVVGGLAQELNGGFVETASGARIFADGTQELEIALTAMANAGIKGGEAGTHMRNMLLKLSDPTDEGTKSLEAMGVTIFDTEGKMRSLTDIMSDLGAELSTMSQQDKIGVISALFNTRDMASAEALLGAVEQKYVKIGDEIMSIDEAYKQFGDDIYDTSKGFEIVQSSWDEIGESVLNAKISLDDVSQAITDSGFAWSKYGITSKKSIDQISGDIRQNLLIANKDVAETAKDIADAYDISLGDALQMVNSVDEAIQQTAGSASDMANIQLDNLAGDVKLWQSALELAKITVSDELTPSLREFVQFGTSGLTKIVDAFQQGGLAGAMEAFGEVLSEGLAMIVAAIPDFVDAGMKLLGALGQGIVDNVDVLLTAMIDIGGRLAKAVVDLMQYAADGLENFDWATAAQNIVDWLRDALTGDTTIDLLDVAVRILESLGRGIVESVPILLDGMSEAMNSLAESIRDFDFSTAAQNIVDGIADALSSDHTSSFLAAGVNLISALVEALFEAVPILIEGAFELLENFAEGLADNTSALLSAAIAIVTDLSTYIKDNVGDWTDVGTEIITALVEGILDAVPVLIENAPTLVDNICDAIRQFRSKLAELGVELIIELGLGLVKGIPTLIANIPEIISAIQNGFSLFDWWSVGHDIITGIDSGVDGSKGTLTDRFLQAANEGVENFKKAEWVQAGLAAITFIVDGISQKVSELTTKVKELADKAVEIWNNIDWNNLGDNLVKGIWEGISGAYDWITQRISEWAGDVFAWFKRVFKIESPSKLMRDEVGKYLGLGVAEGITESLPEVEDAISQMTDLVENPDIAPDFNLLSNVGNDEDSMISNRSSEGDERLSNLADAIVDAFIRANITVQMDEREFGRIVRKVGFT